MDVDAVQPDAVVGGDQGEAAVQVLRVQAERAGLAAHGEGHRSEGDGQVDPEQDVHGAPAQQLGEEAEFLLALDVQAVDACRQRLFQFRRRLAGAAEGDRRSGGGRLDVVEFAAGGDLEAVDVLAQHLDQPGVGVRLGRVEQLDALGQGGADRGGVLAQQAQVVDVGGQLVVGQVADVVQEPVRHHAIPGQAIPSHAIPRHAIAHRVTSRGKSSPSGLGRGT